MMLQGADRVQDVRYAGALTWADLWLQNEKEYCRYNVEQANVEMLRRHFQEWEGEAERLLTQGLVFPGYDAVVKCSHVFNLLEARGAISVSERVGIIARVRKLARLAARTYLKSREEQGYPWLSAEEKTRLGLDRKPDEAPARKPKKPRPAPQEAAR